MFEESRKSLTHWLVTIVFIDSRITTVKVLKMKEEGGSSLNVLCVVVTGGSSESLTKT